MERSLSHRAARGPSVYGQPASARPSQTRMNRADLPSAWPDIQSSTQVTRAASTSFGSCWPRISSRTKPASSVRAGGILRMVLSHVILECRPENCHGFLGVFVRGERERLVAERALVKHQLTLHRNSDYQLGPLFQDSCVHKHKVDRIVSGSVRNAWRCN